MRIEFNANRGGIGDVICMGWIAQGIRDAGHDPLFYVNGNNDNPAECARPDVAMIVNAMGFPVARGERGIVLGNHFPGYNYELRENGQMIADGFGSRVESWASVLPFHVEPRRPSLTIPESAVAWADANFKPATGPIVSMFPEASYLPREWPLPKWVDLGVWLRRHGYDVRVFLRHPKGHSDYRRGPWDQLGRCYHQEDIMRVMAALRASASVVSADSGGAHLAGLADVPLAAVCGPTVSVFAHYEKAVEVSADPQRVPCVGCHFRSMRAGCGGGCEALYQLEVETVGRIAASLADEGDE